MAREPILLQIPNNLEPWQANNWRKIANAINAYIELDNKVNSPKTGLSAASGSKVKIDDKDNVADYLEEKLIAGTLLTLTESLTGGLGSKILTADVAFDHADADDMPDTTGENVDHDTRYVVQQSTAAPTVPAPYEGMLWYDEDEPFGTPFTIGDGAADTDYELKFDGETNDGSIYWMEDEDYFKFIDDILLPDNEAIKFGTGVDMDIYFDGTNGHIRTDLVAASDLHIDCGTDKTILLNETVWDDMRVVPGSFDRPGVSDPTIVVYDVNAGGVNTYLWEFKKNDIASFTLQLPHTYKEGTDISVHVHWTPGPRGNEENGATVGWKVDYSWANIDGAFGTMATADLSDACDGTDHKHQMTPVVAITGTSKSISSMLLCNIKRTDTGADDTWASTTTGQLPMLLEIDFHYQIDTMGSRQASAK